MSAQIERTSLSDIKDSNELLDGLNDYAKELAKTSLGKEAIPHLVLAHGFFAWQQLLSNQFPSFVWKSEGELPTVFKNERDFDKFIYDRFFQQLSRMSTFDWLSPEEKIELREKGWQTLLED